MTGASFTAVNGDDIDLCDLKIAGLEQSAYFVNAEEAAGEINIRILNANGGLARDTDNQKCSYNYCGEYDGEKFVNTYWDQDEVGEVSRGSVTLPAGTGLWLSIAGQCYIDPGTEEPDPNANFSLMSSGKAMTLSQAVLLREGSLGVVPTLSASVDLTKLKIKGLELSAYFVNAEEAAGEINIRILNANGGLDRTLDDKKRSYNYCGEYDGEAFVNCYWDQDEQGEVAEGAEVLKMGEGLWVSVAGQCYIDPGTEEPDPNANFYLEFPSIED